MPSLPLPPHPCSTGRQQADQPVEEGDRGGGEAVQGHRQQNASRPHVGAPPARRPGGEEDDSQDPQGHVQAREALSLPRNFEVVAEPCREAWGLFLAARA